MENYTCKKCGTHIAWLSPNEYSFMQSVSKSAQHVCFRKEIKSVSKYNNNKSILLQEVSVYNNSPNAFFRNLSQKEWSRSKPFLKLDSSSAPFPLPVDEGYWRLLHIINFRASEVVEQEDLVYFDISFTVNAFEKEKDVIYCDDAHVCPICGGKTVSWYDVTKTTDRDNYYKYPNLKPLDIEYSKTELEKVKNEIRTSLVQNELHVPSDIIVLDYLRELIDVESSIRYYEDFIEKLFTRHCEPKRNYVRLKTLSKETAKTRLKERQDEIDNLTLCIEDKINPSDSRIKEIIKQQTNMVEPISPLGPVAPSPINIPCPQEPTLQKAGLFNKSQIKAENERKLSEYNDQMELYKKSVESYNDAMRYYQENLQRYNNELQEYNEQKIRYDVLFKKTRDEIVADNKNKYDNDLAIIKQKQDSLEHDKNNIDEYTSLMLQDSTEKQWDDFFCNEIDEAKQMLTKFMQCKQDLLAMNVIFPKYLDFIAITTIYEYFISGRVSELTGPHGAYNLYEEELRQNIIIGKLDAVIEKLETIKQSQYTIYDKLCEINNNIEIIGSCLNNISSEISSANKKLDKVVESSSVTAYYSKKTAQYAKQQVQLTNAIGYLIAFK
jgi:hypothetical protein